MAIKHENLVSENIKLEKLVVKKSKCDIMTENESEIKNYEFRKQFSDQVPTSVPFVQ